MGRCFQKHLYPLKYFRDYVLQHENPTWIGTNFRKDILSILMGLKKIALRKSILKLFFLSLVVVFFLTITSVILLRFINPPFTPLMVYRWVQENKLLYSWRSISQISPFLQQAVMTSEDQAFVTHHGFDWNQVEKAIEENRDRKKPRGASTITMQVARNLFLWQSQSWIRKLLEAYFTMLIEFFWPKWRIMEVYLNIAEWGNGVFGAEACARESFRISANDLNKSQAATMAAVLPNPRVWSAAKPSSYILSRRSDIMEQMNLFKPLKKKY
jgi:monofunctional glycosyltransferase